MSIHERSKRQKPSVPASEPMLAPPQRESVLPLQEMPASLDALPSDMQGITPITAQSPMQAFGRISISPPATPGTPPPPVQRSGHIMIEPRMPRFQQDVPVQRYEDRGRQLTATLERGSPLQADYPVVQRLMTKAAFQTSTKPKIGKRGSSTPNIALYTSVDPLLDEYDTIKTSTTAQNRRRQMEILYEVEHACYTWFSTKGHGAKRSKRANAVKQLLDDVQTEHAAKVQETITQGLRLNTGAQLSGTEDARVQRLWQQLVAGGGNIEFTELPAVGYGDDPAPHRVAGFKDRMLPLFARLLASQAGRDLVDALLAGPQGRGSRGAADMITIRPLGPLDARKGRTVGAAGAKNEGEAVAHKTTGVASTGAGSYVTYSHILTDSTLEANNLNGDPLLTPVFIAFGHELIHALHNLRGVNAKKRDLGADLEGIWGNMEEQETIEPTGNGVISENQLRVEHGLVTRDTHGEGDD